MIHRIEHAGHAYDGKNGFAVMQMAKGVVLFDRMAEVAAASGPAREQALKVLCADLGHAGRALARFHEAHRSGTPVPDAYKHLAITRVMGLFEAAREAATSGPLLDDAVCSNMQERLQALAKEFFLAPLEGTVCIGDVHPGNIAVENGECTIFDVSTLVASLGSRGVGIAAAADDRLWFAETIPWHGRKLGLVDSEGLAAREAFLNAYRNNSPLGAAVADTAAARFFALRSAMMDLRSNPHSQPDFERALSALGMAP